MVYTERTEKCISPSDSGSNSGHNASKPTSAPTSQVQHGGSGSGGSSRSWSKNASAEDKWKYNNMVRDNREKFNSLHFS